MSQYHVVMPHPEWCCCNECIEQEEEEIRQEALLEPEDTGPDVAMCPSCGDLGIFVADEGATVMTLFCTACSTFFEVELLSDGSTVLS